MRTSWNWPLSTLYPMIRKKISTYVGFYSWIFFHRHLGIQSPKTSTSKHMPKKVGRFCDSFLVPQFRCSCCNLPTNFKLPKTPERSGVATCNHELEGLIFQISSRLHPSPIWQISWKKKHIDCMNRQPNAFLKNFKTSWMFQFRSWGHTKKIHHFTSDSLKVISGLVHGSSHASQLR